MNDGKGRNTRNPNSPNAVHGDRGAGITECEGELVGVKVSPNVALKAAPLVPVEVAAEAESDAPDDAVGEGGEAKSLLLAWVILLDDAGIRVV